MLLDKGIRIFGLASVGFAAETQKKEISHRFNFINEVPAWDVPIPAGVIRNPVDRFLVEEDGLDPDGPLVWPVPGTPAQMTLNELQGYMQKRGGDVLKEWVPGLNGTEDGLFACDLVNDGFKDLFEAYEGERLEFEESLLPEEKLTMALVEGAEDWPDGLSEAETLAWIQGRLEEMYLQGEYR